MESPDQLKLAYLLVESPVPNTYLGGIMVTDGRGLPLDFRYTEPIQPTKIQQILYGQVLSQYIKREVILETLLKSLDTKFQCLVVEDDSILSYPAKGFVILRATETKSTPLGKIGSLQMLAPGEYLMQNTAEGSPVRLQLDKTTAANLGMSPEGDGKAPVELTSVPEPLLPLLEAGIHMDICEPLKRIEKALEAICQEAGIPS